MNNPFDDRDGKRRFSIPAIIAMSLGAFAIAAALALFFGWIVMLLWNWLMPTIFKLPAITYWQGWGLVLLSHILVKPGMGMGGPGRGHRGGPPWKKRMEGRFGGGMGSGARHGPDGGAGPAEEGATS